MQRDCSGLSAAFRGHTVLQYPSLAGQTGGMDALPDPHEQTSHSTAELLALPVAVVLAFIFLQAAGPFGVLSWLAQMLFHEVGHALVFWMRSIPAIPSFGLTQPLTDETSYIVFLVVVALSAWGLNAARRAGHKFLAALLASFLVFCICFSLLLPARIGTIVMLYGGLGGELYLATLAMIAFYETMPKRFEWRRNRYLFLILGAASFSSAAQRWYRAKSDLAQLPMGGLFDFGGVFNAGGESMGDLDRLIREFGWTNQSIVSTYAFTTLACIAAIFAYYFFLWFTRISPQLSQNAAGEN